MHISASYSPRAVIAVGDPDRAEAIAREVLGDARLLSRSRGLLLYAGTYKGAEIGVAVHGMGAGSAAIVFEELHRLGTRVIVRLGSAGSLKPELGIGDVVVAASAAAAYRGGVFDQYFPGTTPPNSLDPELTAELLRAIPGARLGYVVSSDAFYAEDEGFARYWASRGALAVEMECAVLAALSWLRGFRAGCVLVIVNAVGSEPTSPMSRFVEVARYVAEVIRRHI